jgi:hypothetical protein
MSFLKEIPYYIKRCKEYFVCDSAKRICVACPSFTPEGGATRRLPQKLILTGF